VKCRFRLGFEILNFWSVQTDEGRVHGMRSLGHITSAGIVIERMTTARKSRGVPTCHNVRQVPQHFERSNRCGEKSPGISREVYKKSNEFTDSIV
jgi:hypothetical protein